MGDSKVNLDKSGFEKVLTCIEYPGIVKNDENMIKTLGGIAKISQILSESKKRLELKFHPKNIYSKPTNGDIVDTGGLLLKVKIRKSNNTNDSPTHEVKILGKIRRTVKFSSLCDFQYLPLLNNSDKSVSYVYNEIVPQGIPDLSWFEEKANQPLLCIPTIFSKSDSVATNLHRGLQRNNLNNDVIAVVRNKNIDSVEIISFNLTDPIPIKPDSKVLKRLKIKYVSDEDLQRIKKCFEECPIWNRQALVYETKISNEKLKCILASVAYYFITGPWRTMYVRYGYDPRKDFESRFYQTFDWRMRKDYGLNEYIINKREFDSIMKEKKMEAIPSTSTESNEQRKLFYPFLEEDSLPYARQCMYRYCDLHFPKIKEMLQNIPSPLPGAKCNEKSGWLPLGFEEECRELIWCSITKLIKSLRQKKHDATEQPMNVEEDFSNDFEEDEIMEEVSVNDDDANDDDANDDDANDDDANVDDANDDDVNDDEVNDDDDYNDDILEQFLKMEQEESQSE